MRQFVEMWNFPDVTNLLPVCKKFPLDKKIHLNTFFKDGLVSQYLL
jgi:hypothetical protein